jgi:YVTN family beta-propeller protein
MPSGRELKVFLAGRVAVEADGVLLGEKRFPGRQGRLLFACLVVEQGRPVPRDELAEALWGEAPPATWEKALTVLVSKLRGLLAECGLDGAKALTSAFGCYRLDLPDGAWVDVIAAADALREAEAALAADDLDQAQAVAMRAASLARLSFMPGEEGAWVEGKRRELTDILHRAFSCLAEACLRSGDEAEATKWAEQAIAIEPYRETGYRRLMAAHAAAGNRAEALRVYERCRRLLAADLGAYPSPETESIYRELLEAPSPKRDREPKPGTVSARRLAPRTAVGVAAVMLALTATAVAGALATRGGNSHNTTLAANAVGLIDARGDRVRDQVEVGAAPTSVAFGAGAVWVTSASANTVSRIDPETRTVRQTIPVGNSPSGIAVGGGGVWVANHGDGTVSWINPQSNTVVQQIRVGNGPTAVAFGYGSVWVTNSDDRTVSRIDAGTGDVVRIRTGAVGRGIAVGAGSVWVTDESTRTVVRVDPATNRVTGKATVGSGPAGIVYGDGALWVANELDGTVSEIDATTLAVRAAIPVAGGPSALAFGEGGLWVAIEFGQRLVRIEKGTRRESVGLRVGNRPKGLAAVPGGVWVAVQPSGTGHHGGRLVILGGEFDSIDPGLANPDVLGLAYDGLTAFRHVGGSEGTQLVPDLAVALPLPTDGGRSYRFTLRDGIRYSDGSLLRAQDFRRALERMLPLGGSVLQGSALTKIIGASSCLRGRPCDLSRGIIVSGPNSLTVRLSAPDPRLLLALTLLVPVPGRTPPKDVGTKPIPSTGPYAIESYVPGRQLKLVRNSYFRSWSQAARPDGYPDEIVWRIGVWPDKAVRQVIEGKADLVHFDVPTDRVEELAARYPRRLHLIPQRATAFVFLNTRRAPFDDVRVRRALNYAVDRRKMADLHGGPALAQPTCQTVPPTVPGYRRYCPYTADPDSSGDWKSSDLEQARALVAASGTNGEEIVVWTFPYFGKEGRYFVSLLRRLGYRAQLKEIEDIWAYFDTITRTPSVQAGFAGWFGGQIAADTFATLQCDFASNWARFCDPRFDGAVRRLTAEQASDPAAGAALAARLDRELVDRAPWVPLFTPRFADFASKRVGNFQPNTYAAGSVLLDQLWVR